ncbi:nuclear transport factor 2 family protein [Nocardioides eburneiflavus]|uniref:Nuclear transport factor 2 family protein n=1 Tax=Nocardioides eburneiflavus TaxID=2518372 RepID=A0A4Z1CKU9_9ACTN|nr:nuclear transport factor 2 family protein [Nocardioides eburneiflavus]TGN65060.1 nuclear transport factor 2 family protein [Nocardioides eburneiflavus]
MSGSDAVINLAIDSLVLASWGEVVTGILRGEPGRIEQQLDGDAVFYDAFFGTVTGAANIARKLGRMKGRAFNSATGEVRTALSDETSCAVEWIQRLTTPEGPMTLEVASFCSVRDGRITRLCDYVQPLENRKP